MNTETGEIKEFEKEEDLQKAAKSGKWVALERRPNPGCKDCQGKRG